jgi:hypothetical protein
MRPKKPPIFSLVLSLWFDRLTVSGFRPRS